MEMKNCLLWQIALLIMMINRQLDNTIILENIFSNYLEKE